METLRRCLAEHPKDMNTALQTYEERRLPENLALTRTMEVRSAVPALLFELLHSLATARTRLLVCFSADTHILVPS